MRKKEISDVMGNIDEKYINEAVSYEGKEIRVRRGGLLKWGALAACLAAVITVGALTLPPLMKKTGTSDDKNDHTTDDKLVVMVGGIARPYKNLNGYEEEMVDYAWEWEYLTIEEQYPGININGTEFYLAGEMDEALVGEMIGSFEAESYYVDINTGELYHREFDAYKIQGFSEELMVALDMDGKFYSFIKEKYDPPATLGELMDGYSLDKNMVFDRFSLCKGYDTESYFSLENDDPVWEVLAECRAAEFVEEDELWSAELSEKRYISFVATSEILGAYKKVFYVTEDGYVWTNVFDYAYIYDIGEDAAGQIISYALENGSETEYEPYTNYLAGVLTEIHDDFFLVDDSILCVDEDEGMVFKVPTDDMRVSRYVDSGRIKVGDVIRISFAGDIDAEGGNVVGNVWDISRATIYDGDVMVAE